MPIEFREKQNVSMYELLRESGYFEKPTQITEEMLEIYFNKNPELIKAWLQESEDTRSSPAWYFKKGMFFRWHVGIYPGNEKQSFSSQSKACAYYVKKYIENICESQ